MYLYFQAKIQSHPLLRPINTTMELPVVAYAKDSIFTIFVIALPILFNPSTLYNRRSSYDRGNYVRPYFIILSLLLKFTSEKIASSNTKIFTLFFYENK